ncbi:MAG TPA: MFS transporter [Pyrinomonadaceae bacterium]|nr:MFS transporter [Pyrinomonadaceae bacterium]
MNRSPLAVILVTVFIDLVGFGIVIPVLPLYVPEFGATPRALGVLLASYSVMQLVFTPILGNLSDRYGRRPVLLLSLIGTGIGFIIMGSARTLTLLFVGRILDGITGGNISTAQAYIADVTTTENRARGMGLFGAAFGLGFIFGPAIGGILSSFGMHVPFLFAGALAFANALLLYFVLPETVRPGHPARAQAKQARRGLAHFWQQLGNHRLAVVLAIYFLFVVAFSVMTTTFALYTLFSFGYDAQHNGYLFAYIGIIAVIVQGTLIGSLVKRWGEVRLVLVGAAILATSLLILPFVGPHAHGGLAELLLLLAANSIGNSLATPALNSLASKSVSAAEQGSAMGVTQSAASLARIIGPIIGGWLIYSATAPAPHHIDTNTLRLTFWAASAIMFAALLLTAYFARAYTSQTTPTQVFNEPASTD